MKDVKELTVPPDFPRETMPGAVTGVQPKLLARLIDGEYVVGMTDAELHERYVMCHDLVEQLVAYCRRKAAENGGWTHAQILERVRKGTLQKAREWQLSDNEVKWLLGQVSKQLDWLVSAP